MDVKDMKPIVDKKSLILKAYNKIATSFKGNDNRDRNFTPECVGCSFGYVRGFFYNESDATIYLIHYVENGYHKYSDIFKVDEDDAYLCAEKILNDEFTFAINRHHPLYVGEKVYDNNEELICEVVEINGKKIKVSQEKYVEENKKMFDIDCEDDAMEWETEDDAVYQFADGVTDAREGKPVCYEHTSIDYPFFSPYLYENLYTFEVNGLTPEDRVKYIEQENGKGNCDDEGQVKITIVADKNNLAQHLRDLADSLDEEVEHYETGHYDAEIDWEY